MRLDTRNAPILARVLACGGGVAGGRCAQRCQGEGGAAGFAKGGAKVDLAERDGGTLLSYQVEAQIGGKLAQLGQRLINGTAKKLADEFFANFANAL
ncbi:Carbon monoxide dehydrogenase subunit G (CoxG) [Afipia sp. GAS231]|nr:Carbon monoxide dehydrogenase subunit G (CoxG) [Afipia sp. GAS231]